MGVSMDVTRRTRGPSHHGMGIGLMLALLCLGVAAVAGADARDQALRIHDRLVGVPPDPTTLQAMANLIQASGQTGAVQAAEMAMQHPAFYNVSLRNFAAPWTNVEGSVYVELNDYIATVIGMIRDDHPWNEVLSADLVYVGQGAGLPAYSVGDNDHYRALEEARVDLSQRANLDARTQSSLHPDLTAADAAGIVTTRAAAEAFFSAGTNRRMWRFTSLNFLCRDLEQLHDTSRPADRVRQDVNRSPGGDSLLFHNQCVGCHAGQDGLAGAYAYYEWDGSRLVFTPGQVADKHLINDNTFPGGYVTVDDSWINFWRHGPNAALGWTGGRDSGNGAASLGVEVASSRV